MIKVLGLKDFGIWLKKGEVTITNNYLGLMVIEQGYAKFIRYVTNNDKRAIGEKEMNRRFKKLKKYKIPLKNYYSFRQLVDIIEKIENETI